MKLTFFGRLRDSVGAGELECSPPTNVLTSESLRLWIGAEYPDLLDPTVRIAIDNQVVRGPAPIDGAAEVAFLPPVSGG